MSDWSTMETAPKDGTHFLGWSKVYGEVVVWWSGQWDDGRGGGDLHLTHWMPLPEAPTDD